MAKKIKPCPGWLMTFADLMSLLMAFFVLLYSMSVMDPPRYQQVVESLSIAFGQGEGLSEKQEEFFQSLIPTEEEAPPAPTPSLIELKPLYESLIETFSEAVQKKEIQIEHDPEKDHILIIFPSEIAFASGRATLRPRFIDLLRDFFALKDKNIHVQVIGHTDSIPMRGGRFASNWELSSARAASVIEHLIKDKTIIPTQAKAIGLADTRPISLGTRPEDHAMNRRVEILITPE